jgi:hypothetical protein
VDHTLREIWSLDAPAEKSKDCQHHISFIFFPALLEWGQMIFTSDEHVFRTAKNNFKNDKLLNKQ